MSGRIVPPADGWPAFDASDPKPPDMWWALHQGQPAVLVRDDGTQPLLLFVNDLFALPAGAVRLGPTGGRVMNEHEDARRIASALLVNVRREVVADSLDSDVTPEHEEQVYSTVRALGFAMEGRVMLDDHESEHHGQTWGDVNDNDGW